MKKYIVTPTAEERQGPLGLIAAGKAAAQKLAHARIPLQAAAAPEGPAWNDAPSAEALDVRTATIVRVRQRFVEHGLEAALARKPQGRPSRQRKRDGRAGARLIAWACSKPPEGRDEWTMQLLADTLVELQVVASVSDEAVRRTRKETNRSPG
jgi:Homeodomain-like domain